MHKMNHSHSLTHSQFRCDLDEIWELEFGDVGMGVNVLSMLEGHEFKERRRQSVMYLLVIVPSQFMC